MSWAIVNWIKQLSGMKLEDRMQFQKGVESDGGKLVTRVDEKGTEQFGIANDVIEGEPQGSMEGKG
jgi:hypothetical protein